MRKKYVIRGVIVVVGIAVLFFFMSKGKNAPVELVEAQPEKTPYTIETENINGLRSSSIITKYGKLVGAQDLTITSKVAGSVTSINVLPGNSVDKNEAIIRLEDSNSTATFQEQRARAQLTSARSVYALTVVQVNQAITDAQSFLQQAQAQYDAVRQNRNSTASLQLAQLGTQTSKAELDYQTLLQSNQQTLENFTATAKNIAQDIELLYRDITLDADQILGVSDLHKQSNNQFENSLGAQNSSTRREAQSELRELLNKEEMFDQDLLEYTPTTIITDLQVLKENLMLLSPLLEKMEVMFQFTHSTSTLSQAQIEGFVATNNTFQSQLQGKLTAITEQINAMQLFLSSYKSNEQSARQQVELIQQQGAVTESTLQDNETLARLAVERAQIAYNNAIENKSQNLATAQNNVDQAQIALNEASDFLDRFDIVAPIKGTIGDVLVDEGEEISPGTPLVTIHSQGEQQLELSLTEEELAFVDVGQDVVVHNGERELEGRVSAISNSANENFTYEVIVELEDDINLLGDLVSVDIEVRTPLPLIPLNVVTILNSNEGLINTRDDETIKPLRVQLGKVRGEFVEIRTQLDDDIIVIISDVKNYNPTRHTLIEH